ncbi:hypothetical protein BB560_003970 [Smittium megazygosporum]|uniref:Uncharacterized protein n=1 Tax=Smittium megazygosporum TaxID=133381 RepID=A0A2T9ZAI4_9FUNG|nr:hypothetical protein BB560_003970 [Smittium megazygosporum]
MVFWVGSERASEFTFLNSLRRALAEFCTPENADARLCGLVEFDALNGNTGAGSVSGLMLLELEAIQKRIVYKPSK